MDAQFDTVSAFLAMGGHALYVWLAYGATMAVLIGSYLAQRLRRRRQIARLRWELETSEHTAPNLTE